MEGKKGYQITAAGEKCNSKKCWVFWDLFIIFPFSFGSRPLKLLCKPQHHLEILSMEKLRMET